MTFLDTFKDDMRSLTKREHTLSKNAIGESIPGGAVDSPLKGLFMPIGSVGQDNKWVSSHIKYTESTHIMYFDHVAYTLTIKDEVVDESGNVYEIKQVEPVVDFGGIIDHHTAFLSLKK